MNIKEAVHFIDATYPGYGLSTKKAEVDAYRLWLKQIPEVELERCVVEAIRANAPYPNPPNGPAIERVYLLSKKTVLTITAEIEWQKVVAFVRRYEVAGPMSQEYDKSGAAIGPVRVDLSPEGERAYQTIGGFEAVCQTMQTAFLDNLRIKFIEAWERGAQHPQLTRGERRKLLGEIAAEVTTPVGGQGAVGDLQPINYGMLRDAASANSVHRPEIVIDTESPEIQERKRILQSQIEHAMHRQKVG